MNKLVIFCLFLFCPVIAAEAAQAGKSPGQSQSQGQSPAGSPADSPADSSGITTIFMAGDSTMASKALKDYPETGWGMPFSIFFDDGIAVLNLAENGRSTRTFIEAGLWQRITDNLQPGDYVFIQFGHNDESEQKADRYTTPEQYAVNLKRFIAETRAAGGVPLLLSPITRRQFGVNGKIGQTHAYGLLSVQVAAETQVEFIDMDALTREYFNAMGDHESALRFMHIPADTHPNYPYGVRDDTHTNELGAREVAQLVLAELKRRNHPLASRLRAVDPKHLELSYTPEPMSESRPESRP